MALKSRHGGTRVGSVRVPRGGSQPGGTMKTNNVQVNAPSSTGVLSAGKALTSNPKVRLGTFHGNHNVAHPAKGATAATQTNRGVAPKMGSFKSDGKTIGRKSNLGGGSYATKRGKAPNMGA